MKFDMSDAWRDATAMMAGNREVLLILAGLFFFLPSLILGLVMGDVQAEVQAFAVSDPESATRAAMAIYGQWWWLLLLITLASLVGYLGLLALLRDNRRPTVAEAIKIGFIGLLPAIGAYILLCLSLGLGIGLLLVLASTLGGMIGALLGVLIGVLAIYVTVKVSLSGPVIAIDKVYNPVTILGRSWRLTKGNSLRLFLFYLLLFIVYLVIAAVMGMIVSVMTLAMGPGTGQVVNAVLSGAISAIVSVVFVAVIAAVHRQLAGSSAATASNTFE